MSYVSSVGLRRRAARSTPCRPSRQKDKRLTASSFFSSRRVFKKSDSQEKTSRRPCSLLSAESSIVRTVSVIWGVSHFHSVSFFWSGHFFLLSLIAWTLSGDRNKIIKFTASFSLNRRLLEMEDVRELEVFSCCVITFFFDSVWWARSLCWTEASLRQGGSAENV